MSEDLRTDDGQTNPGLDYTYYDPQLPEQPDEVFGLNAMAVLRLGKIAASSDMLPASTNKALHALPVAIRLAPLVEDIDTGQSVTATDVRPYRSAIKRLNPKLRTADRIASIAGLIAAGKPLRRHLNQRIEAEFPQRTTDALEAARRTIRDIGIDDDAELLLSYSNPQAQFSSELQKVAAQARDTIAHHRDQRLAAQPPKKPGIFSKAASYIGFMFFANDGPPEPRQVNAYDVGAGVRGMLLSAKEADSNVRQQLPILSTLVFDRLPLAKLPTADQLAFIAPELLTFLFSADRDNQENESLLRQVNKNPHALRWMTVFKQKFGSVHMAQVTYLSHNLLPAIRDVLPTDRNKLVKLLRHLSVPAKTKS